MRQIKKVVANTIYFLIQFVKTVFAMPSGTCRFSPTCSQFAREAIIELPLHIAIFRIFLRVLRCHPLSSYGFDPVLREENYSTKFNLKGKIK